jgi:acyl-ACP thioesterase
MTTGNIFEKEYLVHHYEVDLTGRAHPVAILNYLQDAAGSHARELGVGVRDLMARNCTWVLSRMHLRFERYPRTGEVLQVRTWPATREGHFTCREFQVLDREGRVAVLATSSWAVPLEGWLPPYPLVPQRVLTAEFPTLPRLQQADRELEFPVRRSDLDINRHVNHTIYVGWALDTVPDELADRGELAELEIGFRAETFLGDTVISRYGEPAGEERCSVHQLVSRRDGRELTRLRGRWRDA